MADKLKTGLAIRKFETFAHWNLETEGILIQKAFLDYPGHELDGKEFFKRTTTPKINPNPSGLCGWGTPVFEFFIDDGSNKEPPVFFKIELLMNHYKLPLVTR